MRRPAAHRELRGLGASVEGPVCADELKLASMPVPRREVEFVKKKDRYDPGVTPEQIRRAEELLDGLSFGTFIERRDLGDTFRSARLIPLDHSPPLEVALTRLQGEDLKDRAVLYSEPLTNMHVQLVFDRAGERVELIGWLEASHPGRRESDAGNRNPTHVARFYEHSE